MDAGDFGSQGSMSSSALFDLGGDEPTVVEESDGEGESTTGESEEETSEAADDTPSESDDSEDLGEDDDSEEVEEESEEEEPEEEPKKDNAPLRKKPFLVKNGEEELKLSPKTTIQLKVQGEDKDIPISDLAASYASKQENAAQYYKLEEDKKSWEAEKQEVVYRLKSEKAQSDTQRQEVVNLIQGLAKNPNKVAAFGEMLDYAGVDPLPVVREIRQALLESAGQYLQLTAEQRKLLDYEEEVNYHKFKSQKQAKLQEEQQRKVQFQQRKQSIMQKHGIPDDKEFFAAYERVQQAKIAGTINVQEITPEIVGVFYEGEQQGKKIREVVSSVSEDILKDSSMMRKIYALYNEISPTDDELREAIRVVSGITEPDKGSKPSSQAKGKIRGSKQPSKSSGTKKQSVKLSDLFL